MQYFDGCSFSQFSEKQFELKMSIIQELIFNRVEMKNKDVNSKVNVTVSSLLVHCYIYIYMCVCV